VDPLISFTRLQGRSRSGTAKARAVDGSANPTSSVPFAPPPLCAFALNVEPVSKPRRSRRREEADAWETKGIRLLTSAATSFRKGFEIASFNCRI
jgi:hypothetical protein